MTDRELMQQALEAMMTIRPYEVVDYDPLEASIAAMRERLAQPVQEPVGWPCVIAEADFEQNTITVEMQCSDYKVSAGQHWLYTAPPQRKPEAA